MSWWPNGWSSSSSSSAIHARSSLPDAAFLTVLFGCVLCALMYILWVSGLACPGCAYKKLSRRLKYFILLALVNALLLSVAMEFVSEYSRQAELMLQEQTSCSKWTAPGYWLARLASMVSWGSRPSASGQSECSVGLLGPVWRVNPLRVLLWGLSDLVVVPAEIAGLAVGACLAGLMSRVPLVWQPVALLSALVLGIVCLMCLCGYEFRLPLMRVGPAPGDGAVVGRVGGNRRRGSDGGRDGDGDGCRLCLRRRARRAVQRPPRVDGRRV